MIGTPQALLDPSVPAWTADGRKAEILSVSILALQFPIEGMLRDGKGARYPVAFSRTGQARRVRSPLDDIANRPA